MAWLNWSKRIKLMVDNTNVDGTLSDFPVLIKISNSSGIGSTNVTSVFTELGSDSNRKKIAVTTSDGETQCYVEIERFDYSNSVAWLWVKIPSVSSGATTDLYLYYDQTQSDNTAYVGDTTDTPAQSVWDSNFQLVMHMAQDPNGDVADAIKDSTSNANHGTPAGAMTSADLVDGKVGKAIDFDGGDNYVDAGNDVSLNLGTSSFTISCLAYKEDGDVVISKGDGFSANQWTVNKNCFRINNNYYTSPIHNPPDNEWHHLVFIGDRSSNIGTWYLDGVSDGGQSISGAPSLTNAVDVNIGKRTYDPSPTPFRGKTDEVRISNIARSDDWIKATYYSNWDELISFGSEQVRYISGYVKEGITPVNRQIYLHNRDTGVLITSTTSSGAGGYFYCETTYSGAHYVVCLDDEAGVDYNDLIYGNIYPVTTSG